MALFVSLSTGVRRHPVYWKFAFTTGVLSVFLVFVWFWLKAPYDCEEAHQAAEKFVELLQKGEIQQAYEMTLKNSLVGKTEIEFKKKADHQLCSLNLKLVSHSPLQTNGNRLRRRLKGKEVEMPEIRIEFENIPCLFSVSLRHAGKSQWKVHNFQSHAG